eukprot:Opistho-2@93152
MRWGRLVLLEVVSNELVAHCKHAANFKHLAHLRHAQPRHRLECGDESVLDPRHVQKVALVGEVESIAQLGQDARGVFPVTAATAIDQLLHDELCALGEEVVPQDNERQHVNEDLLLLEEKERAQAKVEHLREIDKLSLTDAGEAIEMRQLGEDLDKYAGDLLSKEEIGRVKRFKATPDDAGCHVALHLQMDLLRRHKRRAHAVRHNLLRLLQDHIELVEWRCACLVTLGVAREDILRHGPARPVRPASGVGAHVYCDGARVVDGNCPEDADEMLWGTRHDGLLHGVNLLGVLVALIEKHEDGHWAIAHLRYDVAVCLVKLLPPGPAEDVPHHVDGVVRGVE